MATFPYPATAGVGIGNLLRSLYKDTRFPIYETHIKEFTITEGEIITMGNNKKLRKQLAFEIQNYGYVLFKKKNIIDPLTVIFKFIKKNPQHMETVRTDIQFYLNYAKKGRDKRLAKENKYIS